MKRRKVVGIIHRFWISILDADPTGKLARSSKTLPGPDPAAPSGALRHPAPPPPRGGRPMARGKSIWNHNSDESAAAYHTPTTVFHLSLWRHHINKQAARDWSALASPERSIWLLITENGRLQCPLCSVAFYSSLGADVVPLTQFPLMRALPRSGMYLRFWILFCSSFYSVSVNVCSRVQHLQRFDG